MSEEDGRLERFIRSKFRSAGTTLGQARRAYRRARTATALPGDEGDRVNLVCRRHAERRAVTLDDLARPDCYEEGHPDCEGCLEDLEAGRIETWEE